MSKRAPKNVTAAADQRAPEKRTVGTPWKPGTSGNPGGRAKGLERLVRETVGDDITKIIKAQASIAQGKIPKGLKIKAITAKDMTAAATFIGDRGWGKARAVVDVTGDFTVGEIDYTKLTVEQLDRLIAADTSEEDADDPGPQG